MNKEENEKRIKMLKSIVSSMPEEPGSYQFYDSEGTIIYVGKAKNLKNRVSTYFHKEVDRFKTKVLVSKIFNISYTIVHNEEDALLLENSLIKKYNPRYNVLLKDGKTYPSICITNELLPRIFKTRQIDKKFGSYYGPYSHLPTMNALLDLINKIYKPRTCKFPISKEGVKENKYKACLEYHIHHCEAPCIGKQDIETYRENIRQAREILKGNTRSVRKMLYDMMRQKADELKFEEAEEIKKKYLLIDNYCAKSEVVSYNIANVDVFSIVNDEIKDVAFINYIHVNNGTVTQSFTFEYKRKLDEQEKDILSYAIQEIRSRFDSSAPEILVPFDMDWTMKGVTFTVPTRGDRRRLMELSEMNCKQYKFDRLKQSDKLNPEQKSVRLMKELQTKLKLKEMPYHIECFDNSNISGTDAVAGCVVFKGMKPSKRDYRRYNIQSVHGADDYASMQEVVRRRYSRMIEENAPLPNLIVTDGGKGQMSVVREVIVNELGLDIPIAGLAKNNRHKTNELLFGFPPEVVGIDIKSELFRVLTQLQEEVHRYAISFHRDKRSKRALHSELDDIKGIGPITKEALIKHFKTIKAIKEADLQHIIKAVGPAKANIVYQHWHNKETNT